MNVKIERMESNLVKEIGYIIANDVKERNVRFVTITDVTLATDQSYAKVYFTVLNEDYISETLSGLKKASGYIRHELRTRVDMRQIPELEFVYDKSIDYGMKIEKIIDDIHDEK